MANSYSIGSLFNIPVRVHVTLLIFLPLFALSFAPVDGLLGLFYGALGAIGLFASVALHEVGHSLVARAKGSRILEILLLPIGGMARLDRLPPRPADEIQTALAGPAVSLALGIAGWWYAPLVFALNPPLGLILHALGRINLMLVLFNLIPSFPMDGGRVFRAALTPRLDGLEGARLHPYVTDDGHGLVLPTGRFRDTGAGFDCIPQRHVPPLHAARLRQSRSADRARLPVRFLRAPPERALSARPCSSQNRSSPAWRCCRYRGAGNRA